MEGKEFEAEPSHSIQNPKPKKRKRRRRRSRSETLRPERGFVSYGVAKYWRQRYSLFSRYDDGIQMDEEGWFSVTPETIAAAHAARAGGRKALVVDCFAGVGGNAIQFAARGCHVIAIDIDPRKIRFAANNAKVYGVKDDIDFVVGDFFKLAPFLKADVVFLSPPWGGPSYSQIQNFTLDLLKPKDGYSIFQIAQTIAPNIIMFLPRNVDVNQVEELSWLSSPPLNFEIEENYVESYLKGITAYFGCVVSASPILHEEFPPFSQYRGIYLASDVVMNISQITRQGSVRPINLLISRFSMEDTDLEGLDIYSTE